jgi:ubiquinone/menaquinone biosynthesis C-methylase UbiE
MNRQHLDACSSAEWAETLERWILPWVLDGIDLGEDVLEVGPGPGLTTELLRVAVPRLTTIEIHDDLAAALTERLAGTNVEVIHGDATRTPLSDDRFTAVVCLTMLHHIPTAERQDALFAELYRILRPGGLLVGEDSLDSEELRDFHVGDTYLPIDPATLPTRLEQAGFAAITVDTNDYAMRFRARKPERSRTP